ncbi:MAG: hypothetical protein LBO72_11160 [Helicobacteraceae bacterium]|jgi:hypothetical protein|nr:hypothetical protein [Helicobacteraceae bacterium]
MNVPSPTGILWRKAKELIDGLIDDDKVGAEAIAYAIKAYRLIKRSALDQLAALEAEDAAEAAADAKYYGGKQ